MQEMGMFSRYFSRETPEKCRAFVVSTTAGKDTILDGIESNLAISTDIWFRPVGAYQQENVNGKVRDYRFPKVYGVVSESAHMSVMRIPRQTGHRFHRKLDTHSTANWTVGPAQTGHRFHSKLDSL
jgi:hypothetical protein